MTGAGLLGLFLLKHGLLAHVVDFGYSASRRASRPFWYVALAFQCLAEMAGTLFVLSHLDLQVVVVVLLIELSGHATTALMERDAPLDRLLVRHLLCESGLLLLYAGIVGFLVL